MRHFALIGQSLRHSFSKRLFDEQQFPDADYRLWEMASVEGLRGAVARDRIEGFNVTVPFKEAVMAQLDGLDSVAREVGAVNCVAVHDGLLVGCNTDAQAFDATLQRVAALPGRALVLGTGGASCAVCHVLRKRGMECVRVSRHPERCKGSIGYDEARRWPSEVLLVNATPVGTLEERSPWPWPEWVTPATVVYDLVYNPSPSLLLRQAAARGARTLDGLAMLRLQAELSWRHWQLVP